MVKLKITHLTKCLRWANKAESDVNMALDGASYPGYKLCHLAEIETFIYMKTTQQAYYL